MSDEDKLLQKCLDNLKVLPDIRATLHEKYNIPDKTNIDGILTIHSPVKSVDYPYTIQPYVTSSAAQLTVAYVKLLEEKIGHKPLLITQNLSESAIDKLIHEKIEFIDSVGNIYLNNSVVYIFTHGKHRRKNKPISYQSFQFTNKILELIYILLKKPDILRASLEELASLVDMAPESISETLKQLYKLGYLQRQREGKYFINKYNNLLERWEIGYAETLRPKLFIGAYTPALQKDFSDIKESIIELGLEENFLIGGELGAALATYYLMPTSATLHVNTNHSVIAAKLKLKPSPQGEIIFIQQFGKQNAGCYNQPEPIADPLLLHAELLLSDNDRLRETAERIYEKFILDRQQNV